MRLTAITFVGFDRGPNDGKFGIQTQQAVKDIQKSLGLKVDGICGPITWKTIRVAADNLEKPSHTVSGVADRTGKHPHPKLYKCPRGPLTVDSVVLHQTGCKMGLQAHSWDRLNAHIGITRDGLVVIANSFLDWIWHAQGLSRRSIGVEIAGNFPGIKDNLRTLWKGGGGPHYLTQGQLYGLDIAMRYIRDEAAKCGMKIRHVFGHRQSKNTRTADPGSEIWDRVGLDWQSFFSATDGGDNYYTGSGKPIPHEWDVKRTSKYWS